MKRIRELWLKSLVRPLMEQLRQGSSPEALTKSVAWGFGLALCPLLGVTTLLCGWVGATLKLNHVVMQSVNYLAYPVQIALLIPFVKLGDWLYDVEYVNYSLDVILKVFEESPRNFFEVYGRVFFRACSAWILIAPILAIILAFIVKKPIRRLSERISS